VQSGLCANPIDLSALGVPQGHFLVILAKLIPKVCDPLGTAPVIYGFNAAMSCAGN
jgi:hypothetical protein